MPADGPADPGAGGADPFGAWLGRELHDRVAQGIAAVLRNLELAEVHAERDPAFAAGRREAAVRAARQALEDVRGLSTAVRRPAAPPGLATGLDRYLRLVVPPDVDTEVSSHGDESLIPGLMREELFLVLREAVLNAVRHSGAHRIAVLVSVSAGKVRAEVADDGSGIGTQPERGTGLSSMQERVAILGGTLTLFAEPRRGTRVRVQVPLRRGA